MPASRIRRPAGSAPAIARGFAAMAGHERALTILRAHQRAGRLAHAYCLTGEEGVGKTAVARALAEELLLGQGQPSRLDVHPDFWCDDRPEAISIDEIRFHPERGAPAHDQSLQQFLSLKPFVAPLRVALLANADALAGLAHGRPGWAMRALTERDWALRLDRWADELAPLAFEDADGVLSFAARFGQGPQAEMRVVASDALRGFTAFLRDAMLLQAGLLSSMSGTRKAALETWVRGLPADHVRASLAAAQRTQLLIDENVNPRLAMEVMLLDLRVRRLA